MKPSRFTEEQIIGILREEAGLLTFDACRKHGISNLELLLLLGWPHPLNIRTAVPREACTLYPAQRHVTPGGIETSPGAAKTLNWDSLMSR